MQNLSDAALFFFSLRACFLLERQIQRHSSGMFQKVSPNVEGLPSETLTQ